MIVKKNGILAPEEYFDLTVEQLEDICNGCGPKGWGWVVPDKFRIIGLDLEPACQIHDFCYHMGYPKKESDNMFLDNNLYCASKAPWIFRPVAEHIAFVFYLSVKNLGGIAYKNASNKNK